jgi:hypothetical protein
LKMETSTSMPVAPGAQGQTLDQWMECRLEM